MLIYMKTCLKDKFATLSLLKKMKEEYKTLVYKRNEDLWREVNAHFTITIKESEERAYLSSFTPEGTTLFVDNSNLDPAAFTHELLHLYLKQKQTWILRDLSEMTLNDNELLHLFSQPVVLPIVWNTTRRCPCF